MYATPVAAGCELHLIKPYRGVYYAGDMQSNANLLWQPCMEACSLMVNNVVLSRICAICFDMSYHFLAIHFVPLAKVRLLERLAFHASCSLDSDFKPACSQEIRAASCNMQLAAVGLIRICDILAGEL